MARARVDAQAMPDIDALVHAAVQQDIGMLSAMAANNEVGTSLPLERIGDALAERGPHKPLFHTDAVQALGRIPLDLERAHIDLASFSMHKIGGPLGVGLLYKKKGVSLAPLFHGGGQENGLRPGTENAPAICAAALAVELALAEQSEFAERTRALSHMLWRGVHEALGDVELLGPPIDSRERLPNTLALSIPGVDGRVLVARLDLEGLEASAGSACASGSLEPSHVLLAMGLASDRARSGLRLSLGRSTSAQDIHMAVDILRKTLATTR